ncbi:unnamed protein product [Durusdinium trenchii]|uniref:Uncharacterized protein n=1 Tax=Durusdinium trenchii TaxID=1381693 RepID=A0ABP0IW32_9DINO
MPHLLTLHTTKKHCPISRSGSFEVLLVVPPMKRPSSHDECPTTPTDRVRPSVFPSPKASQRRTIQPDLVDGKENTQSEEMVVLHLVWTRGFSFGRPWLASVLAGWGR